MNFRTSLLAVSMLAVAASAAFAGPTEIRGTKLIREVLQTNDDAVTFTGTTSRQVTATGFPISIPSTATGFFVATFTAESNCSGTPGEWCTVAIACDGVELLPGQGIDFAFDAVGPVSSVSDWHSLSMTRRSGVITGGNHTCEVRTAQLGATDTLRLDDWTFEIQFWKQ
jgi:hypothetical protein